MTILKIQDTNAKSNAQDSHIVRAKKSSNISDKVYGTGRRKNAIARVWVKTGTGSVTVNKKNVEK